jgi:hypothetical protein
LDVSQKKPIEEEEEKEEEHIKVDEELANKISLFFAYPTPMMKVLIDTTTVSVVMVARTKITSACEPFSTLCSD